MFDYYYIDHKNFNMIIIFLLSKSNSAIEVAALLTGMKYDDDTNSKLDDILPVKGLTS